MGRQRLLVNVYSRLNFDFHIVYQLSIHSDHFLSKDLKSLSVTGTIFVPGFFDHINGCPTLENIYPALRKRMVKIFRVDQLELQVNNKHELNELVYPEN